MQVTREIQHASEKALQAIKGASVTATEQIVQHTSRQIMAALSDAANTEADRLKNHLGKFAEGLKAKLNAVMGAPIEYDVSQSRFYTGAIAAIAIVGVAGVFVGSACFGSNKQLTVAEAQQLIIGREFLEVLPRLDQPTKQKLMRALKERERVHSK
jgi:pyridoxal biosynthesis lyase PdxS